ncbi:PaaI family thioesterase [Halobacillus sp. BBL2006]|uniref:PaaI family thioesterase n=1 Tax=Halobacillus sp. BBL2006 TaxID=1543706 RepID=UPI000542F78A|nr:PaaI family thioesterase [Halobacillus sp. BBL2006]KHE66668.1 phenylacetic acid degradation protein [Halobacillus sp. BBL2006]
MTTTLEEVRESFETSPFFEHIGFEIDRFEAGDVILKLTVHDKLLNANGKLHGGVHASMIDIILGMAIRSTTKTRCTTISLNTHYLASLSNGTVMAKGRILQQGYKIVTAEGELYDDRGEMIAKGMGSYKLLRTSE